MNFNIVESDYTKDFYSLYNKIKKDLEKGMKVKDIKKKYGLSDGSWRKYYKELSEEGILKPRHRSQKEAKFYTYYNGHFIVQKWKDGTKKHIGTFNREADAQECVRLMKECNWDLTKKQNIVDKIKQKNTYAGE